MPRKTRPEYVSHRDVMAREMKPEFRYHFEQRLFVQELALAIRSLRKGRGLTKEALARMVAREPADDRQDREGHRTDAAELAALPPDRRCARGTARTVSEHDPAGRRTGPRRTGRTPHARVRRPLKRLCRVGPASSAGTTRAALQRPREVPALRAPGPARGGRAAGPSRSPVGRSSASPHRRTLGCRALVEPA